MNVGEIFVALGFKVNDKGAREFDNKIKSITGNLVKLTAVASATIYAIDRFVVSTTRASVALGNFSLQTGLSAQKLQQWQFAATMANTAISADQVTQSITALSQALMEIRMGSGNPEAFRWLGVNPMGKDAFQVLQQLSATVKNLDPAFASMQLRQIGLSEDFLNVLLLSNEELEKLFSQAPDRNNAYIKSMEELGKLSKEFRVNMQLLLERVVVRGMPAFRGFYNVMERGFRSLNGLVDLAADLGERMYKVWTSIPEGLRVISHIITAIRFPIVALALLLDDIATWFQGGESLFGKFYQFIDDLTDKIVEMIQSMMSAAKGLWGIYQAQGNKNPDMYSEERKELQRNLGWDAPDYSIKPTPSEDVKNNGGFFTPIPPPPPPPPPPPLPAGITQNINVYGGGDPQATANAVVNQSQRALNHAYADQTGGMKR